MPWAVKVMVRTCLSLPSAGRILPLRVISRPPALPVLSTRSRRAWKSRLSPRARVTSESGWPSAVSRSHASCVACTLRVTPGRVAVGAAWALEFCGASLDADEGVRATAAAFLSDEGGDATRALVAPGLD